MKESPLFWLERIIVFAWVIALIVLVPVARLLRKKRYNDSRTRRF